MVATSVSKVGHAGRPSILLPKGVRNEPIPGFVKRRAEGRIITTALKDLKARVEG